MDAKELKQEDVETEYQCDQCGKKLLFDGRGCYCNNRDCIVYNAYVMVMRPSGLKR